MGISYIEDQSIPKWKKNYTSQILSRFAFTHIKRPVNMFGIAAGTLIARQGQLPATCINDNWLLLGRMPNEQLYIVVA